MTMLLPRAVSTVLAMWSPPRSVWADRRPARSADVKPARSRVPEAHAQHVVVLAVDHNLVAQDAFDAEPDLLVDLDVADLRGERVEVDLSQRERAQAIGDPELHRLAGEPAAAHGSLAD